MSQVTVLTTLHRDAEQKGIRGVQAAVEAVTQSSREKCHKEEKGEHVGEEVEETEARVSTACQGSEVCWRAPPLSLPGQCSGIGASDSWGAMQSGPASSETLFFHGTQMEEM